MTRLVWLIAPIALAMGLAAPALAQKNISRPGAVPAQADEVGAADEADHAADAAFGVLAGQYARTLAVMERAFPDDHGRYVNLLGYLSEGGTAPDVMFGAATILLDEVARERSRLLGGASDEALAGLLMARANFLDVLNYRQGGAICTQYLLNGSSALVDSNLAQEMSAEYDARYAMFYDAAANARDGRQEPGRATAEDLDIFEDYVLSLGGSEAQLPLISGPPAADDEAACQGMVLILEAAASLPGEPGPRLRWRFAQFTAEFAPEDAAQ